MKQIEFKTNKGEFVIAEITYPKITYQLEDWKEGDTIYISRLHNGLLGLIGRIPDITEEQANDIIKFGHYCPHNYTYHKGYWDVETNTFKEHNTAIDSLNSLLEANGVFFENPYRDVGCIPSAEQKLYRDFKDKIWNKQQTYLFKKI